jgi:hypothetical protein
MRQIELVFPDVESMAEFILSQRVSKIETDTTNCYIKGLLTDDLIRIAETEYGATILFMRLVE